MTTHLLRRFAAPLVLLAAMSAAIAASAAGERLPVVLVSDSPAFDRACVVYYRQGNDPDVTRDIAAQFCQCLAGEYASYGLGEDALDFFARTLSEDLTAFINEYPEGESWMQQSFRADRQCKNADYGSNEPPPADTNQGGFPFEAATWGGVVRSGPGQEFSRLASLAEGERITLVENTGVFWNDYPWFKILYYGNRRGYQWGGIICSLGNPIEGAYETCH
jgi:hypothetical protein